MHAQHRRRRTALTSFSAAALLAAAPLLTACGNEAHPGAAAVVGGDRIEVAALQAEVRDVRDAQNRSDQSAQLIQNTAQLSRAKLGTMIFDRVLERAAEDAGVRVSTREVQRARKALADQSGGDAQLSALLLQQNGIAPNQIDNAVREQVAVQKLAAALDADLSTPEGLEKVGGALTAASKDLGVDVSPRYGVWDDEKVQLGDHRVPWLTQVTTEQAAQPQTGV